MRISFRWTRGIAIMLYLASLPLHAQELDRERLAAIDSHALAAQPDMEASPEVLASYLTRPARTDAEKVRAIYRWMADRIVYDVDAFLENRPSKSEVADVLKQRSSVCEGFASLFEQLAKNAGLEVVSIKGYAKGYAVAAIPNFDKPNHAWNAVKIDGQWRLVDPTWGAGYVANGKYQKVLSEAFFLAPPEQMMFSHFPVDQAWQLQAVPRLTMSEFVSLPALAPAFFHIGVSGEAVWKTYQSPGFKGAFVRTFDIPYRMVTVLQAPLTYHLEKGSTNDFRIRASDFEKMALVQGDTWLDMPLVDEVFSINARAPATGELMVMGKKPGSNMYTTVLAYQVE